MIVFENVTKNYNSNVGLDNVSITINKGDFVFLDPPYGGTKSRYTQTPFDLDVFYNTLDMLNSKGVNWMLTFDGSSGERNYEYAPPEELYKSSFNYFINNVIMITTISVFNRIFQNMFVTIMSFNK